MNPAREQTCCSRKRGEGLMRKSLLIGSLVTVLGLLGKAATNTVTVLDDAGPGSLRQTIADSLPGDTISLLVTGVLVLSSGELTLQKDLIIRGPGASALALDGSHASRIFRVESSATVAISGLTVSNGLAKGQDGFPSPDN